VVGAAADSAAGTAVDDGVGAAGPGGRAAARAGASGRGHSRFDQPRWVMLRSLAVPGWGQLSNGSWFKALAVAGGEIGLGVMMANDVRVLDRLLVDVDVARAVNDREAEIAAVSAYNDRQATLVSREWLLGGVIVYALTDAYVDAHFRNFKVEFERDPALPEGVPMPRGGRLSFRWSF
jgi:hypothetical protein